MGCRGLFSEFYGITQWICFCSGITKLKFKPAFNPYTEPSMEVFSYHDGKKIYHFQEFHLAHSKISNVMKVICQQDTCLTLICLPACLLLSLQFKLCVVVNNKLNPYFILTFVQSVGVNLCKVILQTKTCPLFSLMRDSKASKILWHVAN